MKDIEKLKAEQEQLKERLHKLIDFINSEECILTISSSGLASQVLVDFPEIASDK